MSSVLDSSSSSPSSSDPRKVVKTQRLHNPWGASAKILLPHLAQTIGAPARLCFASRLFKSCSTDIVLSQMCQKITFAGWQRNAGDHTILPPELRRCAQFLPVAAFGSADASGKPPA